jgi:hypothetical protein
MVFSLYFKHIMNQTQSEVKDKFKLMWKERKSRFLIVFFACMVMLFGLVLIGRSFFLDNNGKVSPVLSFFNGTLKPNLPAVVNPTNPRNNTAASDFAKTVTSPFKPKNTTLKTWLLLTTSNEKILGTLNGEEKFENKYKLDSNLSKLKILEDESIVYSTEPSRDSAALFIQSPQKESIEILSLEFGEYFTSIYYEPSEKLIYYSYLNDGGVLKIKSTNLSGSPLDILESTFLNESADILYVATDSIYFNHTPNCQKMTFKDKSLVEIPCEQIKSNLEGNLYASNENLAYDSLIAGEIYSYAYSNPNRKIIKSFEKGNIPTRLTYQEGSLYLVNQNLVNLGASTWVGKDISISRLNVEDLTFETITNEFPKKTIESVINNKAGLYAIAGDENSTALYKFFKQGFNKIVSYPISGPVVAEQVYWDIYDFGISGVVEVELIGDGYALK